MQRISQVDRLAQRLTNVHIAPPGSNMTPNQLSQAVNDMSLYDSFSAPRARTAIANPAQSSHTNANEDNGASPCPSIFTVSAILAFLIQNDAPAKPKFKAYHKKHATPYQKHTTTAAKILERRKAEKEQEEEDEKKLAEVRSWASPPWMSLPPPLTPEEHITNEMESINIGRAETPDFTGSGNVDHVWIPSASVGEEPDEEVNAVQDVVITNQVTNIEPVIPVVYTGPSYKFKKSTENKHSKLKKAATKSIQEAVLASYLKMKLKTSKASNLVKKESYRSALQAIEATKMAAVAQPFVGDFGMEFQSAYTRDTGVECGYSYGVSVDMGYASDGEEEVF